MRISDWSSDVCSSDLRIQSPADLANVRLIQSEFKQFRWPSWFELNGLPLRSPQGARFDRSFLAIGSAAEDRTSVVWGKRVSVSVDPGGRRSIKKKKMMVYILKQYTTITKTKTK